jgi:hypothetical protein
MTPASLAKLKVYSCIGNISVASYMYMEAGAYSFGPTTRVTLPNHLIGDQASCVLVLERQVAVLEVRCRTCLSYFAFVSVTLGALCLFLRRFALLFVVIRDVVCLPFRTSTSRRVGMTISVLFISLYVHICIWVNRVLLEQTACV